MTGENFFLALATLGVAIGGFGGVAGVLRQASHLPTSREATGLKLIVETAFGLAFFSVLPIVLSNLMGEFGLWQWCSLALSAFMGIELLLQTRRVEATTQRKGSHAAFVRVMLYTYGAPSVVVYMYQVANFWGGWPGVYMAGLAWLLITAMLQFWLFVVYDRTRED